MSNEKIDQYCDKWLKVGLDTTPCDKSAAEQHLAQAYQAAGMAPPSMGFVWFGSPWAMIAARNFILEVEALNVKTKKVPHSKDPITHLNGGTWEMVRPGLETLFARANEKMPDEATCHDLFREATAPQRMESGVWDAGYGQMDANWLGYYDYVARETDQKESVAKVEPLIQHAQVGGWYLPHVAVCFCSDRPLSLTVDERYRLSRRDGPAIEFPDGWKVYAVRSVRVPQWLIETPEVLTPQHVMAEANIEVRTIMLEIYGMEKFITDLGALPAHADEYGSLYKIELPGQDPLAVVAYTDAVLAESGQPKKGVLMVPPTMETAHQAVAWTYHFDNPADYKPILRT